MDPIGYDPWQCAGCGEMTNRSHYRPVDGVIVHVAPEDREDTE